MYKSLNSVRDFASFVVSSWLKWSRCVYSCFRPVCVVTLFQHHVGPRTLHATALGRVRVLPASSPSLIISVQCYIRGPLVYIYIILYYVKKKTTDPGCQHLARGPESFLDLFKESPWIVRLWAGLYMCVGLHVPSSVTSVPSPHTLTHTALGLFWPFLIHSGDSCSFDMAPSDWLTACEEDEQRACWELNGMLSGDQMRPLGFYFTDMLTFRFTWSLFLKMFLRYPDWVAHITLCLVSLCRIFLFVVGWV